MSVNIMRLIPFERVTIKSELTLAGSIERISVQIGPTRTFPFNGSSDNQPYNGTVKESTFKITRSIKGRNSFLPVIRGKIEEEVPGSSLHLTMTMHPFVIVFILTYMFFTIKGGITNIADMVNTGMFSWDGLVPLGMGAALYIFALVTFWLEVMKSTKYFTQLIQK